MYYFKGYQMPYISFQQLRKDKGKLSLGGCQQYNIMVFMGNWARFLVQPGISDALTVNSIHVQI